MLAVSYGWVFPVENHDVREVAGGGGRDNKGDSQKMKRGVEVPRESGSWCRLDVGGVAHHRKGSETEQKREVESGRRAAYYVSSEDISHGTALSVWKAITVNQPIRAQDSSSSKSPVLSLSLSVMVCFSTWTTHFNKSSAWQFFITSFSSLPLHCVSLLHNCKFRLFSVWFSGCKLIFQKISCQAHYTGPVNNF